MAPEEDNIKRSLPRPSAMQNNKGER